MDWIVLYIGLSPSLQRKTIWYLSRKLWIKDWTSPLGIQNCTLSSLAKYVVMILKSWRTSENSVIWPRLVRTGTFSLQKLVLVNVLVIDNPFWTHTIEFIIQCVDKVIKLTRCRLRSRAQRVGIFNFRVYRVRVLLKTSGSGRVSGIFAKKNYQSGIFGYWKSWSGIFGYILISRNFCMTC